MARSSWSSSIVGTMAILLDQDDLAIAGDGDNIDPVRSIQSPEAMATARDR